MNAAEFILENTNLKQTKGFKKAVSLFNKGFSFGEICYAPEVWADKSFGFWELDKLESSYQNFITFNKKKEKYIKDIESRQIPLKSVLQAIFKASSLKELEDIFRPYKRKKKTKATLAREAGLLDFSNIIREKALKGEDFEKGLEFEAKKYIQPSLGFITFETVLKGTQDILIEQGLKNVNLRANLLKEVLKNAKIIIKAGEKLKEGGRYSNFIKAPVQNCEYYLSFKNYDKFPQIKKAWEEGFLKITLDFPLDGQIKAFKKAFVSKGAGDLESFLNIVSKKALDIHALPSVTTEVFDKFYTVSQTVYLSKLKSDYKSLLQTPAFKNKPILAILEKENQMASVVFVSHEGEFVSSTLIDFLKEDVVQNLKTLIESITKNVELGCIAISLSDSVRKFEKLTARALLELNKSNSIQLVMADPRGLAQYVNQPEAKFGFKEAIDNSSLSCYYLAKRVQNPVLEYGSHLPSTLLEVPNFMDKAEVDRELLKVLSYYVCSIGLSIWDVNWGLLKNLNWFKFEEESELKDLSEKIFKSRAKEKKDLEKILSLKDFVRFSKYFKFSEALNLLDRSRLSQTEFSRVKDFLKEKEISLLKGPILNLYKRVDEEWYNLLGKDFSNYLSLELSNPFKDFRKTYKVFSFSKTAEELSEVKKDNLYWGIVTKFSTFGAFIDIGVGVNGLIHLSELSNDYISDARKVLKLGQWVLIKAIKVDLEEKKLSFSKIKVDQDFLKKVTNKKSKVLKNEKRTFNKPLVKKLDKNLKRGKPQNRKPKELFNNPFAALQDLKK